MQALMTLMGLLCDPKFDPRAMMIEKWDWSRCHRRRRPLAAHNIFILSTSIDQNHNPINHSHSIIIFKPRHKNELFTTIWLLTLFTAAIIGIDARTLKTISDRPCFQFMNSAMDCIHCRADNYPNYVTITDIGDSWLMNNKGWHDG